MAIPKSKRSGGPKTSSGRLNASKNALKTGAYSSMIVLPGESEEEFEKLHQQFMNDFMPNDVAESAMVYELTGLTWKKLRLEKLEHAAFIRSINLNITIKDMASEGVEIDKYHEKHLKELNTLGKNKEIFELNRDCLNYLNKVSKGYISPQDILNLEKTMPFVYDSIIYITTEVLDIEKSEVDFSVLKDSMVHLPGKNKPEMLYKAVFRRVKKIFESLVWVENNLDKVKAAVANIKEKKLLHTIQEQGLMRSNDDLSRSFFRVLNELRRHQSWRKDMNTVDIYPENA
jgi:hypothetical protein